MTDLYRVHLNLLVALDALFQEKNVTRAAERLCLSQSAMSNNLQQLRKIFRDELLIREKNKMVLTEMANEIRPTLQHLLIELEKLIHNKRAFDIAECKKIFNIGMSDKWASCVLPQLAPILAKQAPHIKINITPVVEVFNAEPFQKLQCDLTIARSAILPDTIHRQLLFEDSLVCLLGKHHPLTKKKKITLTEYLAYEHIALRTSTSHFSSAIDQYLEEMGVATARNTTLHVPYLDTIFRMVENSPKYIATIANSSASLCGKKYACVIRPLAIKMPRFRFYIAWDKKFDRDDAHTWMRNTLIEIIRSAHGVMNE